MPIFLDEVQYYDSYQRLQTVASQNAVNQKEDKGVWYNFSNQGNEIAATLSKMAIPDFLFNVTATTSSTFNATISWLEIKVPYSRAIQAHSFGTSFAVGSTAWQLICPTAELVYPARGQFIKITGGTSTEWITQGIGRIVGVFSAGTISRLGIIYTDANNGANILVGAAFAFTSNPTIQELPFTIT